MRWCAVFIPFLPWSAGAQTIAPASSPAVSAAAPASSPAASAPASSSVVSSRGAPEARIGFQMHFVPLTAIAFPFGSASGAPRDSLAGRYSWQWVPLELGLGAKVIDRVYVGAYFNLGVGWEGSDSDTKSRCEAGNDVEDDVSCSSVSGHAGVEVRYTFTPADALSGWVGYGIGGTFASQTISDEGRYREVTSASGIELARLSGGLDFRAKRGLGVGPYAIVSIGRFGHQRTEIRNDVTYSGKIDDPALHAWISLGLRLVVFP